MLVHFGVTADIPLALLDPGETVLGDLVEDADVLLHQLEVFQSLRIQTLGFVVVVGAGGGAGQGGQPGGAGGSQYVAAVHLERPLRGDWDSGARLARCKGSCPGGRNSRYGSRRGGPTAECRAAPWGYLPGVYTGPLWSVTQEAVVGFSTAHAVRRRLTVGM